MIDFEKFLKVNRDAANLDGVYRTFKSHPDYTAILEHVSERFAIEYLDIIKEKYPILLNDHLVKEFKKNDSIGSPKLFPLEVGLSSGTIWRYVKVMGDLMSLFGSLDNLNIVEIGAGNGGQAAIISRVFQYKTYTMIDLEDVSLLQKKCCGDLGVPNCQFLTSKSDFSQLEPNLVISNYAFSECPPVDKERYLREVLLRSPRGYLTMNFEREIPYQETLLTNLKDKNPNILKEEPLTAPDNYVVVWE